MFIAIAVVVVLIILFVVIYNNFVQTRQLVNEAFSGMDVYLKKRADLIPNLVEIVKSYMGYEKETLSGIIEQRNAAQKPGISESERLEAEGKLSQSISHLFALAENYPDLKANTQFTELQQQLSTVEEDIAQARKYYNGAVKKFNTMTETIPSSFVGAICGFKAFPFFSVDESERAAVKVDLN